MATPVQSKHFTSITSLSSHARTKSCVREIGGGTGSILVTGSNRIFGFGHKHFDMARLTHERVNSPVSTESPTASANGLVHLYVVNHKSVRVNAPNLGVALGIFHHGKQVLARLLRPPTDRNLPVAALRLALDTDAESLERYDLLLINNGLQILLRTLQAHSLNRGANFMSVLEVNAKVLSASLSSYCRKEIIEFRMLVYVMSFRHLDFARVQG